MTSSRYEMPISSSSDKREENKKENKNKEKEI